MRGRSRGAPRPCTASIEGSGIEAAAVMRGALRVYVTAKAPRARLTTYAVVLPPRMRAAETRGGLAAVCAVNPPHVSAATSNPLLSMPAVPPRLRPRHVRA